MWSCRRATPFEVYVDPAVMRPYQEGITGYDPLPDGRQRGDSFGLAPSRRMAQCGRVGVPQAEAMGYGDHERF